MAQEVGMGTNCAVSRQRLYLMDRIDGQSLDIHTRFSLDDPVRDRIVAQLHGYVSQLRSLIPPPGTVIGSPLANLSLMIDY